MYKELKQQQHDADNDNNQFEHQSINQPSCKVAARSQCLFAFLCLSPGTAHNSLLLLIRQRPWLSAAVSSCCLPRTFRFISFCTCLSSTLSVIVVVVVVSVAHDNGMPRGHRECSAPYTHSLTAPFPHNYGHNSHLIGLLNTSCSGLRFDDCRRV